MKKLDVVNFLRGYSIFTIVIMHLVGMLGISGIWEKAAAFGGCRSTRLYPLFGIWLIPFLPS